MSSNADVLERAELLGSRDQESPLPRVVPFARAIEWNPEEYAREQIRGLVRCLFLARGERPVKQVVFSATDANTDVASICNEVGFALVLETSAHVAIVSREMEFEEMASSYPRYGERTAIKSWSRQTSLNLWCVPEFGLRVRSQQAGTSEYWLSCLAQLRSEFDYTVIHAPVAGTSSEAALLGQLADGVVLVLGAHRTRRATARKVKEAMQASQARILGTVLSRRTFPVPERLYRRL